MAADIRLEDARVVVEGGVLRVESGEVEVDRPEARGGAGGAQRRALAHGAGDALVLNGGREYSGGVKFLGPAQAVDDLAVPVRSYGGAKTLGKLFNTEMVAVGREIEALRAAVELLHEQVEELRVASTIRADAAHHTQEGWRYCGKCSNLHFAPNNARSRCPLDGGVHLLESAAYVLFPHRSRYGRQNGWKWCRKCQGLSHGGQALSGHCPAGGAHDRAASPDYFLWTDAIAQGSWAAKDFNAQADWRWCNRCYGLCHQSNPGVCPAPGGGPHNYGGSGNYHLMW